MNAIQKNKIEEMCCDTNIEIKKVTENERNIVISYNKKCFNKEVISYLSLINENGKFEILLSERI